MARQPSPIDSYKKQATNLQKYLADAGHALKRTHALEAVARMHGYDDYHQLAFDVSRKGSMSAVNVTKWLRRHADSFFIDRFSVVAAFRVDGSIFAAYAEADEQVGAMFIPAPDIWDKTYREGEAFANDCPPEILSILTPTDDIESLLWREGAWIRSLRNDLMSEERITGCVPWVLLSARGDVDGFHPKLAARSGIKSRLYGMCDWREAALRVVGPGGENRFDHLPLGGEQPLDSVEQSMRNPRGGNWVELGRAPFRIWVKLGEGGGYVTWTADPWHYANCVPGNDRFSSGYNGTTDWGEMNQSVDAAQPVLEIAARSRCANGERTFEALRETLCAGEFDPAPD